MTTIQQLAVDVFSEDGTTYAYDGSNRMVIQNPNMLETVFGDPTSRPVTIAVLSDFELAHLNDIASELFDDRLEGYGYDKWRFEDAE